MVYRLGPVRWSTCARSTAPRQEELANCVSGTFGFQQNPMLNDHLFCSRNLSTQSETVSLADPCGGVWFEGSWRFGGRCALQRGMLAGNPHRRSIFSFSNMAGNSGVVPQVSFVYPGLGQSGVAPDRKSRFWK